MRETVGKLCGKWIYILEDAEILSTLISTHTGKKLHLLQTWILGAFQEIV